MNTNNVLGGAIVGGIIVYILMQKRCKKCGEKIQGEPTTTLVYPPIYYQQNPALLTTTTTSSTTTIAPKNFVGFTGLKGIM